MPFLKPDEQKGIADAVARAESASGGEVVVAIIPESDDYAFRELLFSLFVGGLTFFVLSFFAEDLNQILDRLLWNNLRSYLPLSMFVLSVVATVLMYILTQIPALDRIIIGKQAMAVAVKRRALRYFMESAVADTANRGGVLLFVSVLERRVEIIADRGINDLVAENSWEHILEKLIGGIRQKQIASAIVTAVDDIGAVLAQHIPPSKNKSNELSNKAHELKKGS